MTRTMAELTLRAQFDADQRERTDEERSDVDRLLSIIVIKLDLALRLSPPRHRDVRASGTRDEYLTRARADRTELWAKRAEAIAPYPELGHRELADLLGENETMVRRTREKLKGMAGE